jgi:hypothetical protein
MNNKNALSQQMKGLITGRKSKITIYIIAVLWIAVFMQIAVNATFQNQNNFLEAFVSTNSEVSSSELEMAANYGIGYLSEADRRELILFVAGEMGLQIDQEVVINREENNCEISIQKNNKNAETLIKIVSVEQENTAGIVEVNHYLLVNLKIYKNLESILSYRDLLKKVFNDLKATDLQTTIQLTGSYKGKLSLEQMNVIADNMINELEGKIAYANRQEDLFTVYAYSGLLDEYVSSVGTKINIHVAINYDEITDSTNVYLGTPVINGGY